MVCFLFCGMANVNFDYKHIADSPEYSNELLALKTVFVSTRMYRNL